MLASVTERQLMAGANTDLHERHSSFFRVISAESVKQQFALLRAVNLERCTPATQACDRQTDRETDGQTSSSTPCAVKRAISYWYDTIRDAILTCARKCMSQLNLPYGNDN